MVELFRTRVAVILSPENGDDEVKAFADHVMSIGKKYNREFTGTYEIGEPVSNEDYTCPVVYFDWPSFSWVFTPFVLEGLYFAKTKKSHVYILVESFELMKKINEDLKEVEA